MYWKGKKIVVFGGGGFLGRYIIEQLHEQGCTDISSFGRSKQPELLKFGITVIEGDLQDYKSVEDACVNCDIVFLTAAKAGVWGTWTDYYNINVLGAKNVIKACKTKSVNVLVYTSSPSVAYSAEYNIEDMDEDNPYPSKYLAHYPRSKAIAEKLILEANCSELKTVALRPHLIWGPRDPHLVPRIIQAAKANKLMIVGTGKNKVDMTYVENGAHAHLCAAEALSDKQRCRDAEGKAYFISDDKPVVLWDWTNELLKNCNIPPVLKEISYKKAFYLGFICEVVYKLLPFLGEPPMTRFIAGQLSHSHWFNISSAKSKLQYKAIVDPSDGLQKLLKSLPKYIFAIFCTCD